MYLSKIYIKNFRGIKELLVKFDKKLNVIIGANGQLKTSLMDAIRLFYTWGEPNRDIEITKEDFHVEITENPDGTKTLINSTRIDICYLFEELSAQQEGAFYQYLVSKNDDTIVARIHISFEMKENGRIYSSYITGKEENGLRADWNTFHYFHPYYLGALRDSTRDLMSSRNNLLGRVIKRKIDRAGSENDVKGIVDSANEQLLLRPEVIETQTGINDNLNQINSSSLQNVELHIEQSRIEYMLKDSGARNLLVIDQYQNLVEFYDGNVISLDSVADEAEDFELSAELISPKPENLAYMIYTSGSTGKPKGVMIEHRNLLNLIEYITLSRNTSPDDIVAEFASFCFDASVIYLF